MGNPQGPLINFPPDGGHRLKTPDQIGPGKTIDRDRDEGKKTNMYARGLLAFFPHVRTDYSRRVSCRRPNVACRSRIAVSLSRTPG